jgi:hypothetical protein
MPGAAAVVDSSLSVISSLTSWTSWLGGSSSTAPTASTTSSTQAVQGGGLRPPASPSGFGAGLQHQPSQQVGLLQPQWSGASSGAENEQRQGGT